LAKKWKAVNAKKKFPIKFTANVTWKKKKKGGGATRGDLRTLKKPFFGLWDNFADVKIEIFYM
jgi:hypothetical protein